MGQKIAKLHDFSLPFFQFLMFGMKKKENALLQLQKSLKTRSLTSTLFSLFDQDFTLQTPTLGIS